MIKNDEDMFDFLKTFAVIIVSTLYISFLTLNPVNNYNISSYLFLLCCWAFMIGVIYIHLHKDESIEYKLGSIGSFILPIIFYYYTYVISKKDSTTYFVFIFLYTVTIAIQCLKHTNNKYYKVVLLIILLFPYGIIEISNIYCCFYQNTLLVTGITSLWLIIYFTGLPYLQKMRKKVFYLD